MLALFAGQLLVPTVFTRFMFAIAFWAVAIDVLSSSAGSCRRCSWGCAHHARSARRRSGPYPTRPFAYAVTSCSRG